MHMHMLRALKEIVKPTKVIGALSTTTIETLFKTSLQQCQELLYKKVSSESLQ